MAHAGSVKVYINPESYHDPNQAVKEFTSEINNSYIVKKSKIGEGM
jgi:hypothetical protein